VKGEDPLVPADHPQRMKFYGRPDSRAVVWLRPQKPPAEVPDAEYPFFLTTGRVIEHWHTATMTGTCKELVHANMRSSLELHADDAKKLAVKTGDPVRITSRRGVETFPAKVTENASRGLVFLHMHDRDRMCNILTIDAFDDISKEPEFKICAVKLEKA
jgi:nitrate reductase NapA